MVYTCKTFNTEIPGMHTYDKNTALKDKAHDAHKQQKEFIWLLKG